jgi:hypothetical protein
VTAVRRCSRPVDPVCRVQLGEQDLVDLVKHACLAPALKPAPTRHPEPNPSSLGQIFPADPGIQHEQNALQAQPVRDRSWPGAFAGKGGNSGSISFHNLSSTTHALPRPTERD